MLIFELFFLYVVNVSILLQFSRKKQELFNVFASLKIKSGSLVA